MQNTGRRFVLGDLHGNHRGLVQILERANFDRNNDTLFFLGDIVDGWGDDYACVEELLTIKNFFGLRGNHDQMFKEKLLNNQSHRIYEETLSSFLECAPILESWYDLPSRIRHFFDTLNPLLQVSPTKDGSDFKDKDRIIMVHAGFNRHFKFSDQPYSGNTTFEWDRDLFLSAYGYESITTNYPFKIKELFNRVYIGHTPTFNFTGRGGEYIQTKAGIINVDTGGGYPQGRLCLLNIDNHEEVYYSSFGYKLYGKDRKSTKSRY